MGQVTIQDSSEIPSNIIAEGDIVICNTNCLVA